LKPANLKGRVLAVDLDGTLIRSDMLFETFWSAMSRNWATPLIAAAGLTRGRAAMKQRLCEMSFCPTTTPSWTTSAAGATRADTPCW
jgi:hypothetical protein